MIGGQDIHLPVRSGPEALDFAVRAILRRWKHAVFVANRRPEMLTYDRLEFHDEHLEVIVYRDHGACDLWREKGYDESLRGTMVYLISDPEDLTIVVEDEPSAEIKLLLQTIRNGIAVTFEGNHFYAEVA